MITSVAVPALHKSAVGAEAKELLCAEPQAGVTGVLVLLAAQLTGLVPVDPVQIQDQPVVLIIGLVAVPALHKSVVGAEAKELLCAEPQTGVIKFKILKAEQSTGGIAVFVPEQVHVQLA